MIFGALSTNAIQLHYTGGKTDISPSRPQQLTAKQSGALTRTVTRIPALCQVCSALPARHACYQTTLFFLKRVVSLLEDPIRRTQCTSGQINLTFVGV